MNRKWAKFTYYTVLIIPRLHYHGLSLERESNKRIRNEASTMSRLSNGVWTKQQTDCTHQGHGLQSLSAVLPIVWKQVLEASCPPGTLGALSICQNWTAKEFIFLSPEMTILVTLLSQNRQFSLLLCRFLGTFVCVNVQCKLSWADWARGKGIRNWVRPLTRLCKYKVCMGVGKNGALWRRSSVELSAYESAP